GGALLYFLQQAESAEEKASRLGIEVENLVQSFGKLSLAQIDQQISEQMRLMEELNAQRDALVSPTRSGNFSDPWGDDGNMGAYLVELKKYQDEVKRINAALEDGAVKSAALARARMDLMTSTLNSAAANDEYGESLGAV